MVLKSYFKRDPNIIVDKYMMLNKIDQVIIFRYRYNDCTRNKTCDRAFLGFIDPFRRNELFRQIKAA